MATLISGLSSQGDRLEVIRKGTNLREDSFKNKNYNYLVLLTNYLRYNGLESLKGLDLTPLDLVSGVHKSSAHGGYLPFYMVGYLISIKIYLTMLQSYPVLPYVVDLDRVSMEGYMSL